MHFVEAISFLFGLRRYPPRPGVEVTRDLLAHLGDPQADTVFVQIAGSNGKGSAARMVENVLREAGLDVGLYTSPHIENVRERVRVNGRRVPRKSVVAFVETVREYVLSRAAAGEAPTFFEALTALACFEFSRQEVDVAVCEVGIGGRYDATSAIPPTASAVTSVALEHTNVLGDTVGEIAADMAHVAPRDRPLVTAATGEARAAIEDGGDCLVVSDPDDPDADVTVVYENRDGTEGRVSLAGNEWTTETRLALVGAHQARNAGVAAVLARQVSDDLGVEIDERTIARGLRGTYWPGRFEVMERAPLVVLDGAHNPQACATLAETVAEFEYEDLYLVFAAMCDKDCGGMVAALPTPERVVTARPRIERAEDPAALARAFERAGATNVEVMDSVRTALDAALSAAGPADCVLVTGSLYAVAEARARWSRLVTPLAVPDRENARRRLSGAGVAAAEAVAGELVSHTIETRTDARTARALVRGIERLGGTGAIAAIDAAEREPRTVVLAGTHAQFTELADAIELGEHPAIGRGVARDLRARLDPGSEAGSVTSERGGSNTGGSRSLETDGAYPWANRTAVMGILNVTPDSFHDGGRYEAVDDALSRAEGMIEAGVDVIDVGGESTRPGADPVPPEDEIERVEPVLERLSDLDVLVSIDTRRATVARVALDAGADVLNDVSGLSDPEMRFVAAENDVPIVLMHSIDAPVVPDREIEYDDVVADAISELAERITLAERAGVRRENVIVDPGFGFGKSSEENFELLGRLAEFRALGCPILVGHSHKSMFDLVGDETLAATIAGSAVAANCGADIVRVHDVAENLAAVRVADAASDPGRFT